MAVVIAWVVEVSRQVAVEEVMPPVAVVNRLAWEEVGSRLLERVAAVSESKEVVTSPLAEVVIGL